MNTNILELVKMYKPIFARGAAGLMQEEITELEKFGINKNIWTRLINNTASVETVVFNQSKVAQFLGCQKDEIKFL